MFIREPLNHLQRADQVKAAVKMLYSILQNLVSNAIKYSHQDGVVTISAEA